MKRVVMSREKGYSDLYQHFRTPLGLAFGVKEVEVASAKPSEILVGSNIDENISRIETKIDEINRAFRSVSWDRYIEFRANGFLTNNPSDYTFINEGTTNTITRNQDSAKMALLRMKAKGTQLVINESGYPVEDFEYECFTNNSNADASFDEKVFITYDKFTKTIKAVAPERPTSISDSEGLIALHVIVQGPELSSVTAAVENGSITPSEIVVTDPGIERKFRCYINNDKNFFIPLSNAGVSVGATVSTEVNLTQKIVSIDPYASIQYHDLTTAVKPTIYSRI